MGFFQLSHEEDCACSLQEGGCAAEVFYRERHARRGSQFRIFLFSERMQVFRHRTRNEHRKQERRLELYRGPFGDIHRPFRCRQSLADHVALIEQENELAAAEEGKEAYKYPVPPGRWKSIRGGSQGRGHETGFAWPRKLGRLVSGCGINRCRWRRG